MAKNQILKKSDLKKNLNKKKISELNLKRRNPVFLPNSGIKNCLEIQVRAIHGFLLFHSVCDNPSYLVNSTIVYKVVKFFTFSHN